MGRGSGTLPDNLKAKGFLSDTGPDPLNYNKATKSAFDVGPSSARQRSAVEMAFRWRASDGLFIVVLESSLPPSPVTKKQQQQQQKPVVKVGPHLTKLSGSAHV